MQRPVLIPGCGLRRHLLRPLFDARGARSWVRALTFIMLFALALVALLLALRGVVSLVPGLPQRMHAAIRRMNVSGFPPWAGILNELALLACAGFATWAITALDGRPFSAIGLRWDRRGWDLLTGWAAGFGLLGLLVAGLLAFGFARLEPPTLGMWAAVGSGLAWLVVDWLTGLAEEMLFRGYLFAMLRERFGFLTGTIIVTALFMLAHGHNRGENPLGLLTAGAISVLFCLAIRRTGALWWVIGFHAAWDWAEDYFFGSADSGSHALDRLFTLLPHGNIYLSGGTDGPEGSLLCLAVLAIGILGLPLLARRRPGTGYSQDPTAAPGASDGGLASYP
jgi:membrane protease YdiL (CAAX protease family)